MNSLKNKLRWYIASAIKDRFKINDLDLLLDSTFYIENIPGISYHVKCGIKMLKCGKSKKISLTLEKWMKNIDYLSIILDHLNDKNRMYYLSSSIYWKTDQKNNIWIKWENPNANNTICDDEKIKDLKRKYNEIRNIDTARALIGGCRKWFSAHRITEQNYFNENFLENIRYIFNNCNLSHNNIDGEEWSKNGEIYKKSKNEKLYSWTNRDFFELCDYIVKFLDCFFAMFEIGDKIIFFAKKAGKDTPNSNENLK
jgi:hypothetical protein